MSLIIRAAEKKDCARMMQLIQELAAYEKAPDAVTVEVDHFEISGFGELPVWWALVAEVDGQVEGFALWYIRYSTWKGQRMYLEDLIITEKMRGKGIGRMLFDQLIIECELRKLNGIVWQVLEWNEPAINFYKKFRGVEFDEEWVNCSLHI